MKIAVCDDEAFFRKEIAGKLYDFFGKLDATILEFKNGKELAEAFSKGSFDLVFLDIEMPELDGMSVAGLLRQNGFQGPIIFLTSHTEMAMEGYEVQAFRFLEKPIREEKLARVLSDLKSHSSLQKKLILSENREEVVIGLLDIIYVEAVNNSVRIKVQDPTGNAASEHVVRRKISDLEEELCGMSDTFVRVHRGYLVNLAHVKKTKGSDVYMSDGQVIPLSRKVAGAFKERLLSYIRKNAR